MRFSRPFAVLAFALPCAVLPAGPAAAACGSGQVLVQAPGYNPAATGIDVGDSVVWCWTEGGHSVTFDDGKADSGVRDEDATYTRTFSLPGSYAYGCSVHGNMRGTVLVEGQSPSPSPTRTPTRTTPPPTTSPPPSPARTTTPPATTPPPSRFPSPSATPTPTPTTAAPTTTPPASSAPATTTPPPAAEPSTPEPVAQLDPPPAKPNTGLAIAAGLVVAAASIAGAVLVWRGGRRQ